MFCTNCGKEIEDDSRFCPFCGAKNTELEVEQETTENTSAPAEEMQVSEESQAAQEQQNNGDKQAASEPVSLNKPTENEQTMNQAPQMNENIQQMNQNPQMGANPQGNEGYYQVPNNSTNVDSNYPQGQNQAAPKKKGSNAKTLIIIGGIVVVLAAGGGIGGYFAYQNYVEKQADKVITLFDDEDYDESIELYDKYCIKKDKLREKVETEFSKKIDEAMEQYQAEELSYYDIYDLFDEIKLFDNEVLDEKIKSVRDKVDDLDESRENYKYGLSDMEDGYYEDAITYFSNVIAEDKNYEDAQTQIKTAQEKIAEEAAEEERERLAELKQDALDDASDYAYYGEYDDALESIQEALSELPEDQELKDAQATYETMKQKTLKVEDASITFEPYDKTYKEGETDIATVSLKFPKLAEEIESYKEINELLMDLQDQYISYGEDMAEDARSWCTEEGFYPSSVELDCELGYNDHGILSFKFSGYDYYGGAAHGTPYYRNYMFNLATGRELDLEDIIAISEDDFHKKVVDAYTELANKKDSTLYPEAMKTVEETYAFDYTFYLANDGIHIYFDPYVLADYATGFVEVVIPYEGVVNFLDK